MVWGYTFTLQSLRNLPGTRGAHRYRSPHPTPLPVGLQHGVSSDWWFYTMFSTAIVWSWITVMFHGNKTSNVMDGHLLGGSMLTIATALLTTICTTIDYSRDNNVNIANSGLVISTVAAYVALIYNAVLSKQDKPAILGK